MEVVEEEEEGGVVDGTKVDMESMEGMVDMEGRGDGTSINVDLPCGVQVSREINTSFL